ncbi:MAG: acetylornithine deacetylase [Caulobacterales bacterium]|nr:acetylornithine deacetylase [Caulobacterales bacterium]
MTDLYERSRAALAELVAFDTTSRNSNLALIDHVEARLEAAGARTWRVPNEDGDKANLYGLIGPDAPGGVVLSGHTDVVPVDGQPWTTDPWTLTERDGRLYGRGTCDMKGFIACALGAAGHFTEAPLAAPIGFAFSYDEEIGCLGAPSMIARIAAELPPARAVIVGEPTDMKVVSAHKGIRSFRVAVEGREAHSSQTHQGASAVMAAAELMGELLRLAAELEAAAAPGSPFHPPHATLTIGRVEGGTATNILARRCEFFWEMRPTPESDPEGVEARFRAAAASVEAAMRERAPEARVTVERLTNVPPLAPEPDGAAERLARALTGDNASNAVAYAAEGGQFQEAGFSTVICGPGSIAQAHQPDEFIEIDQLRAGARFMARLAEVLATE